MLWNLQNSTKHDPELPALTGPMFSNGLDNMTYSGPFQSAEL